MKKLAVMIIFIGIVCISIGQDRYFAQTYTSSILLKGSIDLEGWHTSRIGHEGQFYHAMDQRLELEIGLGKNVQTAFYFNSYQAFYSDSAANIQHTYEAGFSNEWKWQFSKPASRLGKALYEEFSLKGDEFDWETKLILDRSFGHNLIALNLVNELDYQVLRKLQKNQVILQETPVELDLAYMRNFNPVFGIGLELRNNNGIAKGKWQNSVLFSGPVLSFRGDRWFLIANYLPQLYNLHKTSGYPKVKVLDDHEKTEIRVIAGVSIF